MHETAFIWSDGFLNYSFPGDHPFKSYREKKVRELLDVTGLSNFVTLIEPDPPTEDQVLSVHDREYVNLVKTLSIKGEGLLDSGDTPAFKGIFEASLLRVSGTITAVRLIAEGKFVHAFNVGGGLHHAKKNSASGFCVFNDVAIGVKKAEKKFDRVAIVDLDGHHADGTQQLLYSDPRSLKVSLHMYHRGFFPGTGDVDESGEGEGENLTVNVPLPPGTGDEAYLLAFDEIVMPRLRAYSPQLIFVVLGGDSHYSDPLVELKLSTHGYMQVLKKIHSFAESRSGGRLILLGGGGYNYDATARIWTLGLAEILGIDNDSIRSLHDPFPTTTIPFTYNKVLQVIERLKELPLPPSPSPVS